MARDILDLGADVFDDTIDQKKHRLSPKKRNYIIGLSVLGLILGGYIAFWSVSANTWLLDYTNLQGLQFYYSPKDESDPNATEPTLTLYKLGDVNKYKYPSTFRIPEKVKGLKVTAIAPEAFNNHQEIKEVIFTSYIDTIGDKAFAGCTGIESFRWNNALSNIGNSVFDDTAFYKKLQENPEGCFTIPNCGVLLYLGQDYFKQDNIALVSDSFSEEEKANVMSKFGIASENFVKFSDIGKETSETGTTAFVAGLFKGNSRIGYIDFPEFLHRLGNETFMNCKNLKGINFTHSEITSITKSNFNGCTSLETIEFSDNITEIGDSAFENTKITALPANLDKITKFGDKVFYNCSKLEKVYYPNTDKLTKVPKQMFGQCSSLSEFYWEDEENSGGEYIKSIGAGAFAGTSLETFYVPKNVNTIHDDAFKNCTSLKSIYFYGNPNEIYDEDTIAKDEYGVYLYETEISKGNFDIQNFDTELVFTLGERDQMVVSANEDGDYVFEINNPSSEFTFEKASFTLSAENYSLIKKAILKEREKEEEEKEKSSTEEESSSSEEESEDDKLYVMVQDDSKFFSLFFEQDEITRKFIITFKSITSYTIDDEGKYHLGYLAGISDIRQDAFLGCTKLNTIYLYGEGGYADKLTPEGVFSLPKSLTWLSKSEENLSETMSIFSKTAATKIYIDSHLRKIGGKAFNKMTGLSEVEFAPNSSLNTIGEEAFSENTSLTTITLPKTLKILGPAVFYGCTNLEEVGLKDTQIETIDTELFSQCSSLKHIDLPESVTKIADKAFDGNTSLDYVVVPSSVNLILKNAFVKCSNQERGQLPVYLNMTEEAFNKNPGISKDFHDSSVIHYFLLAEGQERTEGVHYWNGNQTNPAEI